MATPYDTGKRGRPDSRLEGGDHTTDAPAAVVSAPLLSWYPPLRVVTTSPLSTI
jgi:hypothetical protein